MNTILVVEDEQPIRSMLGFALNKEGYSTVEAGDVNQAQVVLSRQNPDLILLDWMLPDASGIDLLHELKSRHETRRIPIIMLTAKSGEEHKITGLKAGADDFVTKPFSPGELIARIQAILRRTGNEVSVNEEPGTEVLCIDELKIDKASHRVSIGNESIELGPTEYRLLVFLMEHPERVFSRETLLNQVWGRRAFIEERTVDVHVLRLRRALEKQNYDRYIQTVRGIGYRFSKQA